MVLGVGVLHDDHVLGRDGLAEVPADERGARGDEEGRLDGAPAVDVLEDERDVVFVYWEFAIFAFIIIIVWMGWDRLMVCNREKTQGKKKKERT